tara:strand:+ start:165 stop:740 length:576 start_codon:yes stop_codon:yes gene_type:complete
MKKINQLIENYLNWSNDSKKFIKIFQILFYYIPAILIPLGVLITIIQWLTEGGGYYPIILLIFGIIWALVFGYFSFNILWRRAKDLLSEVDSNKYFVIPALAHYIRTYGEVIGAVCFTFPILLIGLQISVLLDNYDSYYLFDGIPFMENIGELPIIGIFILPLYGYFVLLSAKLISESLTAVVEIANNTRK